MYFGETHSLIPEHAKSGKINSLLAGRHLEQDQAYMGDPLADPCQNQPMFSFSISAKIKQTFPLR